MPRPVAPHRLAVTWPRRSAGLLALAVFVAIPSVAQPPAAGTTAAPPASDAPAARSADAPANNTPTPPDAAPLPDAAAPPDAASPLDAAAGAETPEAAPDGATEQPAPAAPAKPAPLPRGFAPPAEPHPSMTIRKPTMSDAEITKEQNDLRKFGGTGIDRAIRVGDLTPQTREMLGRYARLQIARMAALDFSNPDERRKIGDISSPTLLNLRNAGFSQGNPAREREFREAFLSEMAKACSEVILDNNFWVRLQAATFLSEMNVREEPPTGQRQPPISYVPAMTPLLDVLADEQQPEAVKVAAAKGVGRLAEYAESIPVELRYRAGAVLTQELARKGTHPWYQMRLAEALASIELDFDKGRQPIVLNALLAEIGDNTRHCLGRSASAKALGRAPAPAGAWNDKVVATALVQLARDMAAKYNQQPNRVEWFSCYENLYLAFVPGQSPTGQAEDLTRLPTSALLRKGSLPAPLQSAHDLIRPIVEHVLKQPPDPKQPHAPIPTELIKALDDFLKANKPQ